MLIILYSVCSAQSCSGFWSVLSGNLDPMSTPPSSTILVLSNNATLVKAHSQSEKWAYSKIINSSMQKIWLITKPQIKNNFIFAIKVINKQPFLKHTISENNLKIAKDQSSLKEIVHHPTPLHPYQSSMTDGAGLILPIIQFFLLKDHWHAIRSLIRIVNKDSYQEL